MTTSQKLESFINAELKDALLYKTLANSAPNSQAKMLLLEFAQDEENHAQNFRYLYKCITGREYFPQEPEVKIEGSFKDILRERILDESADYRKYGEQYLETNNNYKLKRAYYRARTDENVHALRIIDILLQ